MLLKITVTFAPAGTVIVLLSKATLSTLRFMVTDRPGVGAGVGDGDGAGAGVGVGADVHDARAINVAATTTITNSLPKFIAELFIVLTSLIIVECHQQKR